MLVTSCSSVLCEPRQNLLRSYTHASTHKRTSVKVGIIRRGWITLSPNFRWQERRPTTIVGVIKVEWLAFHVASKYVQCIVWFCHKVCVLPSDGQTYNSQDHASIAALRGNNVPTNYVHVFTTTKLQPKLNNNFTQNNQQSLRENFKCCRQIAPRNASMHISNDRSVSWVPTLSMTSFSAGVSTPPWNWDNTRQTCSIHWTFCNSATARCVHYKVTSNTFLQLTIFIWQL